MSVPGPSSRPGAAPQPTLAPRPPMTQAPAAEGLALLEYRRLLERWLAAGDDALAREAALLAAGDLGRSLLSRQISADELMGLHQRAQAQLAALLVGAPAGSAEAQAQHRLAAGDALSVLLALLLPLQLDEQRRAAQADEALRQNDKHRAVATMAAGVAHDFNNLLGSIIGLSELCLLQAPEGSMQARNLGNLRLAADRAAALVGQLLSFARERPIEPRPLALAAWLEECRPLLQACLPRALGLVLDVRSDSVVRGDAAQLEQVLLNLVKNAGHSQQGMGGVVRVVLDRAPLGNQPDAARLRVIDRGRGIAPEHLSRLFEPFFTTKPVGEGTGLGLAAALGIVRHHGGELEARSNPGGDTTLSVRLPRLLPPARHPMPSSSATSPATVAAPAPAAGATDAGGAGIGAGTGT